MKVLLDTDVLVAALRSPHGASRQVITRLWQDSTQIWLISVAMLLEYEAVLKRSAMLTAIGLTITEVDMFLDAVAAKTMLVPIRYHWRPLLPDPDDDHIAETAINGGAEAIITFNRTDFAMLKTRFSLPILTPYAFIERISQ